MQKANFSSDFEMGKKSAAIVAPEKLVVYKNMTAGVALNKFTKPVLNHSHVKEVELLSNKRPN